MSQKNDTFNPFDPTGVLKEMRTASLDAWSKTMLQVVNSEPYAQATATVLDAWLTSSVPFRRATEAAMAQVLACLNLPSRADVTSLAERLVNIEKRLDDLEAKLESKSMDGPRAPRKPAKAKEDPE